jgi:hypothetical protein
MDVIMFNLEESKSAINLSIDDNDNNKYFLEKDNIINEDDNNSMFNRYDEYNDNDDDDDDDDTDSEIFNFREITHIDHLDDDNNYIKEIKINDEYMDPNYINEVKVELKDDYEMFSKLVEEQMNMRIIMFRRVLLTYIKPYFSLSENIRMNPAIILGIVNMADKLDLENMTGAIISDILFNELILEEHQIKKYKNLILPFLGSLSAQENLLNQILIILNNHKKIINCDNIIHIFSNILKYNLVNNFSMINWYNLQKKNKKSDIDLKVIDFLDETIMELKMKNENENEFV